MATPVSPVNKNRLRDFINAGKKNHRYGRVEKEQNTPKNNRILIGTLFESIL